MRQKSNMHLIFPKKHGIIKLSFWGWRHKKNMDIHGNMMDRNDRFHYELHKERYNIGSHIHFFVEICIVLDGETEITVNSRTETAKSGQCILILPFQEHSYRSENECVFAIYSFSPSFVAEFMKKNEGMVGERAVFDLSELVLDVLKKRFIYERNFSIYNIKACLYFLLTDYLSQIKMVSGIPEGSVIDKLIYYLSKNYTSPCPLSQVAAAIGYNEKYLSGCIQSYLKVNYCSLINSMRVEHSKYLLTETDSSVLDIALECGFGDVRSFQRNFKKIVGATPMEYRTNSKKTVNVQTTSHIFPKSYFGE